MKLIEGINKYIQSHSNLDQHRPYVGMSSLSYCPRQLYNQFKNGISIDDEAHRNSYRGYFFEAEVKKILIAIGFMKKDSEKELIADNDPRIKGHTDGEDVSGNLIEIKSYNKRKYDDALRTKKLSFSNYSQVQAYMYYGKYEKCSAVIVCPETFEFLTLSIVPNISVQHDLKSKASRLLLFIDGNIIPNCECGRCK